MKKIQYKKTYTAPLTEFVVTELSPLMYETSIPQAGDDEEGGEADAKPGFFDEEEGWGIKSNNLWDD